MWSTGRPLCSHATGDTTANRSRECHRLSRLLRTVPAVLRRLSSQTKVLALTALIRRKIRLRIRKPDCGIQTWIDRTMAGQCHIQQIEQAIVSQGIQSHLPADGSETSEDFEGTVRSVCSLWAAIGEFHQAPPEHIGALGQTIGSKLRRLRGLLGHQPIVRQRTGLASVLFGLCCAYSARRAEDGQSRQSYRPCLTRYTTLGVSSVVTGPSSQMRP